MTGSSRAVERSEAKSSQPPLAGRRRAAILLAALGPLLLGLGSLWLAASLEAPRRSLDERRFVIPQGTGKRAAAGLPVDDILPQWITTAVGVDLVVENRDDMRHVFGPFVLDPGQEWRREFAATGEYGFDCSLYPVAGFTIAVAEAPARDAARRSRALSALWRGAAVVLAAALVGALGVATATGASTGLAVAVLAAALPGAFTAAVSSELLAMSRLAAWRPVLASQAAFVGVAAAGLALATSTAVLHLVPVDQRTSPLRGLPPMLLALLATIGLGFTALPGDLAARAGLLGLGGGLLAAALWAQGRSGSTAPLARVALIGFVAVLVALPVPLSSLTPPWHAALALPGLVLATAVLIWGTRGTATRWPDGGWLPRVVGGALSLFATAMLWWAGLRHLEAVSLPLWGNPTASSPASIARGAALWQLECASCHEATHEVLDPDDRALLEITTHGRGEMPAFAYRLDLQQRGDLVNYLRRLREDAAEPSGATP